ncbi:hypothetical protein Tco_0781070, partial [Tanacetum coccineum]
DRYNAVVLPWIMNSVSADVYMGLVYSVDAAAVWKDLESTYDKVDGSIIFNMEFDTLTKLPTCDCDANKELDFHNKLMKLMQFLMGLDKCYLFVRSSLLTRDPHPKVKDTYNIVSREESHKGVPDSSSVTKAKLNATSFAAKSSNNFKRGNNNNSYTINNTNGIVKRGPNPNLSCKKCGMIGHTIERCYELIGYPPGFKKVANPIKQNGFKQTFNANIDMKSNDK